MNVLIVDDDLSTLDFLERFIHWKDIGVAMSIYVKSAGEAKRVLMERHIDLIVCDIEMPQESGLELLEWARRVPGIREMILITCHAEFEYAQKAIQLGTSEYILKPIQIQEFENAVGRVRSKLVERRKLQADSACWNHNKNLVEHEVIRELITSPFEEAQEILQKANEKGIVYPAKQYGIVVIGIIKKQEDKNMHSFLKDYQKAWDILYMDLNGHLLLVMLCNENKGAGKLTGRLLEEGLEGVCAFDFPIQKLSLLADQAVGRYGSQSFQEVAEADLNIENAQYNLVAKRQMVREIKRFLEDHYPEEITMNDIAEMFGYDKDHLTRVFKYHEKGTIMDYLTHIRLLQAKKLLQNNSLTVSEIAGMVGFNSISYFSKVFNKEMGMSAKEYRKRRTE